MPNIWHLVFVHFFTGYFLFSGDSCLDEHLLNVGLLSMCAEICAADHVFSGLHVSVAFPFFDKSFVSGENGRMVCLYERQTI